MLHVAHLSKHYGPFVALADITFVVPHGQIVAIVGPNGAGKSTLIRILAGCLSPSEGTVTIGGFDVQRDRMSAAALTGYLPENVPVYSDMTALDTLRFFGAARGLRGPRLQARIDAVVETCGLETVLLAPIGSLSKGLRQRIGIAQSLLHDPPFVIMDEPASGLDPNQTRQLRETLRALRAEKTVLISTHILSELRATVDRVMLIQGGRLMFDDSPAALAEEGSIEDAFWRLTRPVEDA